MTATHMSADGPEQMPVLHPLVEIMPGTEDSDDEHRFIKDVAGRYFRVGRGVAAVAERLDGTQCRTAIATELGGGWTPELVDKVSNQLVGAGLTVAADEAVGDLGAGPSRFRFRPPLTIQFDVWRPSRVTDLAQRVVLAFSARRSLRLMAAVPFIAVAMVVTHLDRISAAVFEPQPIWVLLVALAGSVSITVLHELAHAGTLVRYGGKPSRLGLMLFYVMPAFFCDVSDGWRIRDRKPRVHVALAGPASQVVLASAVLTIGLFSDRQLAQAAVIIGLTTLLAAFTNLAPFVKLDGYLALMAHLDWPYLRHDAIATWREIAGRALFGGVRAARLRRDTPAWLPWLGAASALFPLYLLLQASQLWLGMVLLNGRIGGLFVFAILALIAYGVVRSLARAVREARQRESSVQRISAGFAVIATAATLLLGGVKVPLQVEGGFFLHDEQLSIVLPDGSDSMLEPGMIVTLTKRGVLPGPALAATTLADARPVERTGPLSAMFGVELDTQVVYDETYDVRLPTDQLEQPSGRAVVDVGEVSVGRWLVSRYLSPAWEAVS